MKTSAKAREEVAIGVAGHRILAEPEKIKVGIDAALERIERVFPGRRLTVISALAEGADRWVVQRIMARAGAQLVVVLPMAEDDYLADFESPESKQEFVRLKRSAARVTRLPPAPSRTKAYNAAGAYVLDHADVLLAVWDGRGAQGEGGTGAIAARARERGLPIAWIHAGNRRPGTLDPTSLGDEQGRVTFENF